VKRFKFSLEKILKLREYKEEECKHALGQAISMLNLIENKIKETAVKHHQAAVQRFNDPLDIPSWDIYILRLEQEAEKLGTQAAKAQIVVDEKRLLYMEAQKDLKAMEKLKEKQKKEYHKKMLDKQMAEVDEITSSRYITQLV